MCEGLDLLLIGVFDGESTAETPPAVAALYPLSLSGVFSRDSLLPRSVSTQLSSF